jgi:hypothetical protein
MKRLGLRMFCALFYGPRRLPGWIRAPAPAASAQPEEAHRPARCV